MRSRLKNQEGVPQGVVLISKALLWVGISTLTVSIIVLLLGFVFLFTTIEEVRNIERPQLLGILSVMMGVPGILLGLMSTISSFGLRKMRRWGLWCSYVTAIMWALFYIGIGGSTFSITTLFGLLINLISLIIISVEVYLTRTYYSYRTRR